MRARFQAEREAFARKRIAPELRSAFEGAVAGHVQVSAARRDVRLQPESPQHEPAADERRGPFRLRREKAAVRDFSLRGEEIVGCVLKNAGDAEILARAS